MTAGHRRVHESVHARRCHQSFRARAFGSNTWPATSLAKDPVLTIAVSAGLEPSLRGAPGTPCSPCVPSVPMPQALSPRERYQKPSPGTGTAESTDIGLDSRPKLGGRLTGQTPMGPAAAVRIGKKNGAPAPAGAPFALLSWGRTVCPRCAPWTFLTVAGRRRRRAESGGRSWLDQPTRPSARPGQRLSANHGQQSAGQVAQVSAVPVAPASHTPLPQLGLHESPTGG